MIMYTIAQVLIQIISVWIFVGAIAFACGQTPKFFKSKKWAVVAHGPLVWYAAFVAKITWQLEIKSKREG